MAESSSEANLHFLDYWRVLRVRWPFITLVFLTVVLTAGITTYFTPKQFSASSRVEIRRGDFLIEIFGRGNTGAGPERADSRFITTQFEIIQTREVLYPVIQSLNLVERWGSGSIGGAYGRLRGMLQVRDIRNTDLIQITVFSGNPEEAAEIANAVAEEYKNTRIRQVETWVNRSLESLQEEVDRRKKEADTLRLKAAEIREKYGIIDVNPDTTSSAQQVEEQLYVSVENAVHSEKLRITTLRSRYDELSSLTDDEILRSLSALNINDPLLAKVFPEMQSITAEEARLLSAGLGPRHPTILAMRGKKAELQKQMEEQLKAMRVSLANQLRIAEESLKALEVELEKSRTGQRESKESTVEYVEAKNQYVQALGLLQAAEQRLATEKMQMTMPQSPAIVWELAEPSGAPVRPNVTLNMLLGVLVGLVLGIGAAFFLEYLDTSVKTLEEVESSLGLPVLAVIPRNMKILPRSKTLDADSEAYRILRTNVEFNRKNPDANTFTVVSGGAGEGKSTTIANLAFTFAQGGYKTLIVDADLRRPTQHKIFDLPNEVGLADYLSSGQPLETVVHQTSSHENLFIISSGTQPSDVVALLSSQKMDGFLSALKQRFDVIFLDSPPILGVSDASVLASLADLTIIVVQHRRFPKSMLNRVKTAITNVGGTVLGVVLNNVDVRHDQNYEYYTNYYKYYSKTPRTKTPVAAASQNEELNEVVAVDGMEPKDGARSGAKGSKKSFDY